MTIEKYLYSYTDAIKQRERLKADVLKMKDELEEMYTPPNMAVDTSKARVQKSELSSPVETAIEHMAKLWDRIPQLTDQMLHWNTIIDNVELWMLSLEPDERNYIKYKYFEDRTVEKISELMHYCRDKVWRIGKSALDKLETEYEKIEKKRAG